VALDAPPLSAQQSLLAGLSGEWAGHRRGPTSTQLVASSHCTQWLVRVMPGRGLNSSLLPHPMHLRSTKADLPCGCWINLSMSQAGRLISGTGVPLEAPMTLVMRTRVAGCKRNASEILRVAQLFPAAWRVGEGAARRKPRLTRFNAQR
jgi:hypothetical protein